MKTAWKLNNSTQTDTLASEQPEAACFRTTGSSFPIIGNKLLDLGNGFGKKRAKRQSLGCYPIKAMIKAHQARSGAF
jgi:hypothetical protein